MQPYRTKPRKKKTGKNTKPKSGIIRWAVLAVLIFLGFVFFTGKKSVPALIQYKQQKNSLQLQETKLIEEKKALKEEIKLLKSDDKYIEKVAREKFNMKKKDETVYHLKKK